MGLTAGVRTKDQGLVTNNQESSVTGRSGLEPGFSQKAGRFPVDG